MEAFKENDYLSLLDDMAVANMNSLMIYVKWLTTGYRSSLPFQDQIPDNPVIASDNALLRKVIDEARMRKIKIWLGGAVTYFDVTKFQVNHTESTTGLEVMEVIRFRLKQVFTILTLQV